MQAKKLLNPRVNNSTGPRATRATGGARRSGGGDGFESKLTHHPAADEVGGLAAVAERGRGVGLVLELDESESASVARLPVPHHDDGAHLPEAGEVLPQVALLRARRDAADEELPALTDRRRRRPPLAAAAAPLRRRRHRRRRRSARVFGEQRERGVWGRLVVVRVAAAADVCASRVKFDLLGEKGV